MNTIKTLLTILVISLLSTPSWSVTLGDLVERNDLYYKQFTDVPYTGEVTGSEQGSFRNGEREGAWISYWDNGQLNYKGNYNNGKREGSYELYYRNGQLNKKMKWKHGFGVKK